MAFSEDENENNDIVELFDICSGGKNTNRKQTNKYRLADIFVNNFRATGRND